MKYIDSISDFLKSPKWMINLLLAGLCSLIPVVGPMVVLGWLMGGFWGRDDQDPTTFPPFDFGKFSVYLSRGLWPMLVALVASVVLMPIIWIITFVPMVTMSALTSPHGHAQSSPSPLFFIVMLVMTVLIMALSLGFGLILKPLMIRASLLQNFAAAFDFRWVLRFLKTTWLECLLAALFLWVASFALAIIGMMALCIGIYFISAPIYFAMVHLDRQLYQLFLSRGGEPLALSPKLRDGPPPLL